MSPRSSRGRVPLPPLRHVVSGCIAAALSLFSLAGCSRRESSVASGLRTGTLHIGNGAEPQELDPQLTSGSFERRIQRALFEGLLVPDPRTARPIPAGASAWETSADGRTVTFALRPEAIWSDGEPVTAEDYVQTFRRLFTPTFGAEFASEYYFIRGAREFHQGRTTDFTTVGVTAVDRFTLRFDLLDPVPQFLPLLASFSALPVPAHVVRRHGAHERRGTAWTKPGNLIGNGPFVLAEWRPQQRIVVTRNPRYRGPAQPQVQAIHFYPVEQADTEERMFRAGQLHYTAWVPSSRLDHYRRTQPAVLQQAPAARNYYYVFNVARPPFDDPRVRRALALAIDRDKLTAQVLKAGQSPARQFTPPLLFTAPPPAQFQDDAATARTLLAAAGFPGGANFPVIPLHTYNNETNRLVAETVQEMWRQQLGIRLQIVSEEWKVYLDTLKNGAYQLSFDGWGMATAQQFYALLTTGNTASYNRWSDATYDGLVASAAATTDERRREELYLQAEELLARVMPVIPIYFGASVHLVHPDVHGWTLNPINDMAWQPISLGR